jgi:hypothetical protein
MTYVVGYQGRLQRCTRNASYFRYSSAAQGSESQGHFLQTPGVGILEKPPGTDGWTRRVTRVRPGSTAGSHDQNNLSEDAWKQAQIFLFFRTVFLCAHFVNLGFLGIA